MVRVCNIQLTASSQTGLPLINVSLRGLHFFHWNIYPPGIRLLYIVMSWLTWWNKFADIVTAMGSVCFLLQIYLQYHSLKMMILGWYSWSCKFDLIKIPCLSYEFNTLKLFKPFCIYLYMQHVDTSAPSTVFRKSWNLSSQHPLKNTDTFWIHSWVDIGPRWNDIKLDLYNHSPALCYIVGNWSKI